MRIAHGFHCNLCYKIVTDSYTLCSVNKLESANEIIWNWIWRQWRIPSSLFVAWISFFYISVNWIKRLKLETFRTWNVQNLKRSEFETFITLSPKVAIFDFDPKWSAMFWNVSKNNFTIFFVQRNFHFKFLKLFLWWKVSTTFFFALILKAFFLDTFQKILAICFT